MSRIGNNPISLPDGVSVELGKDALVHVKGPKGNLTQYIDPAIKVELQENTLVFSRESEQKTHKSLHGLYRSLVNNAVVGVSQGYQKVLELVGVGYKASNQGNILELNLGYSHAIFFEIPSELTLKTEMAKGKNPLVYLTGVDKQLVGQIAAKIKSLRKVEPYKGKGIRFQGEQVRRKAGKTAK